GKAASEHRHRIDRQRPETRPPGPPEPLVPDDAGPLSRAGAPAAGLREPAVPMLTILREGSKGVCPAALRKRGFAHHEPGHLPHPERLAPRARKAQRPDCPGRRGGAVDPGPPRPGPASDACRRPPRRPAPERLRELSR